MPVALVSLVDRDRQFFVSCPGLGEPWASARETPHSHSFCQHVVTSGAPLVIEDSREHPLLADNLGVRYGPTIIFTGAILFLLFVCMNLSMHVSRLTERSEILAEEITFLRNRIETGERE